MLEVTWEDSYEAEQFFINISKEYNFKNILEFGFGHGICAEWFLNYFSKCNYVTFDIEEFKDNNGNKIHEEFSKRYGDRFRFIHDSFENYAKYLKPGQFDFAFLDTNLRNPLKEKIDQILMCKALGISYVLIDNMELGSKENKKKFLSVIGNMAEHLHTFSYETFHPIAASVTFSASFYRLEL